jgi:hypothetical protein
VLLLELGKPGQEAGDRNVPVETRGPVPRFPRFPSDTKAFSRRRNSLNAKFVTRLNDILDLAGYGPDLPKPNEVCRIFGLDEHSIFVKGDAVQSFDSAIDDLLDSMPNLRATLSREGFIDQLIPEVRRKETDRLRELQRLRTSTCR